MARRQKLIPQILAAREAASGREMSPQLRGSLAGKLMSVPSESLEAFYRAGGLGDIEALAGPIGPNAIGDTGADLVYTPVTPCRIIDTRNVGGPIAASTSRDFFVADPGTGTYASNQGGNAGTCNIPLGPATAAVINFVAVTPAGAGDLRATPFGTAIPLASFINYSPGFTLANGPVVKICDPAVTTCTFDITIQADVSATHLVADVQGYFRRLRKEQVKSFSVLGTGSQSNAATTCTNAGGLSATITAPVAGKVVVNTATSTYITHTAGVGNEVDFYWGTSPTACTTAGTFLAIPSTLPAGGYFFPVGATQMFSVAGGSTTTFYFNSTKFGTDTVAVSGAGFAALTATFIPD